MIHDMGHPIAFHLDGVAEAKDFDSMGVSREGIWWLPNESVADFLVLTNQSAASIKFDMALYDASGKQSRHTSIIWAASNESLFCAPACTLLRFERLIWRHKGPCPRS
jgi:hypothetical protein